MIGLFLSFLYYPSVNFIDVADLTRIIVYKGKADNIVLKNYLDKALINYLIWFKLH